MLRMWEFVTGRVSCGTGGRVSCGTGGPVAIETRLGWVLSDPPVPTMEGSVLARSRQDLSG